MPIRKKGQPTKTFMERGSFRTIEGRIIMFPFYLWHCVEPNESNDIRISVSFNFIQQGFQCLNIK